MKKENISQIINRPKIEELDVGDRVSVSVNGGGTRFGVIEEIIPNIKNGFDGILYDSDTEGNCWAYVQQIDLVTKQMPVQKKSVKRKM